MVNRKLAGLFLVLFGMLVSQGGRANEGNEELLVFVGKFIDIKELPDQCPPTQPIEDASKEEEGERELGAVCIQFDALYEARYEVVDGLVGSRFPRELSFRIADHYGFPAFAEYRYALLYVQVGPEGAWLEKYQGYPVHRTVGGSWAACGNPFPTADDTAPASLRSIDFADDMGTVGEFSSAGLERRFIDDRYLSIVNGRIRCRMGVAIEDLYDAVRTGVMAAREIILPELR
jgi:hypothetical protein